MPEDFLYVLANLALTLIRLNLQMTIALLLATGSFRVVPGHQLGSVMIGERMDQVVSRLGSPDPTRGDAAMGKAWSAWVSKSSVLTIYSTRDEHDRQRVKIVHTNSPSFKLANGLKVGSSWRSIKAHYSLKRVPGSDKVEVWDSVKRGIAFDIAQGKCVGIAVHRPGMALGNEYLSYASNALSN